MKNNLRYDGIQALRFFAAILVVITHSTFYVHERLDQNFHVWNFGTIGVDIFFIISGFIIVASSGISEGKPISYKEFIKRRILRIIPMYWFATSIKIFAMIFIPSMILHANIDPLKIFLSYFLLPQINSDGRFEPILGVGWTLIYEMFFYAIFAFCLFLNRNPVKWVGIFFIILSSLYFFRQESWPAISMYLSPIILYFVIGMLLFYMNSYMGNKMIIISSFFLFTVFIVLFFVFDSYIKPLLAIFIFMMVISIEPFIVGRLSRFILFQGEASYVLYLFHPLFLPVIPVILLKYSNFPGWVSICISIPLAIFISSIIHKYIEKPTNIWLKRLI